MFFLRAVQSHNPARRESKGLITYMQVTIGMGFIGIVQDLVKLLRVLLVKSTVAVTSGNQATHHVLEEGEVSSSMASQIPLQPESGSPEDNPRLRFRYRRFSDVLNLAFLAAIVPGIIGNSHYKVALTNDEWAAKVMQLRWVSLMLCFDDAEWTARPDMQVPLSRFFSFYFWREAFDGHPNRFLGRSKRLFTSCMSCVDFWYAVRFSDTFYVK